MAAGAEQAVGECHVAWAFHSASVAPSPHQMYLVWRHSY
jgi:hypothetical protein